MKNIKRIIMILSIIVLLLGASIYAVWHNEIATLISIKTIVNQDLSHDDGYTYEMNVSGDYYFGDFIRQGGAKTDSDLISFVTKKLLEVLFQLKLKLKKLHVLLLLLQRKMESLYLVVTMILIKRIQQLFIQIQVKVDTHLFPLLIYNS